MSFNIEAVQDGKSLLAKMHRMDITVPPRGKGRDSRKHVEPRIVCQLLAALSRARRLTYPFSLEQREKPDFLIKQGDKHIGVEVSDVIPRGYSHCVAVAQRVCPDGEVMLLEPGHFRDDRVRSHKEVLRLINQPRLSAPPFYGDEPEQEWARFMASRIKGKLDKLAEYETFDENWLALYDNLPLPRVNRRMATDMLRTSLSPAWPEKPAFDAIFIKSNAFIIKVTRNDTEWLDANDILTPAAP